MPVAWTPQLAASIALFLIAAVEALPAWGRWIPGHLGLAIVAAVAVALGAATPWLAAAAVLGAVVSDLGVFAWIRLRPMRGLVRRRVWWRAGLDVDDLGQQLRRAPVTGFTRAKFSTRERARLPYAAHNAGFGWAGYATLSVLASLVWAPAWLAVGGVIGYATVVLPSEGAFVVLAVSLVALSVAVSQGTEEGEQAR